MNIQNNNNKRIERRTDLLEKLKNDPIEKIISSIGEQAMIEAKMNGTYIAYMDDSGDVVKEYPDGRIIKVRDSK